MKSHETKFDLEEPVTIIPLDVKGVIKSIFITASKIQYEVRYFYNAKAEMIYFYENELKGIN